MSVVIYWSPRWRRHNARFIQPNVQKIIGLWSHEKTRSTESPRLRSCYCSMFGILCLKNDWSFQLIFWLMNDVLTPVLLFLLWPNEFLVHDDASPLRLWALWLPRNSLRKQGRSPACRCGGWRKWSWPKSLKNFMEISSLETLTYCSTPPPPLLTTFTHGLVLTFKANCLNAGISLFIFLFFF